MPSAAASSQVVQLLSTLSQVAYTIAWMAVSSLLGWYKNLYGPQVLLLMNVAYFLPSIPLLVVSSLLDAWLEDKYGEVLVFHADVCGCCAGIWSARNQIRCFTLLEACPSVACTRGAPTPRLPRCTANPHTSACKLPEADPCLPATKAVKPFSKTGAHC